MSVRKRNELAAEIVAARAAPAKMELKSVTFIKFIPN